MKMCLGFEISLKNLSTLFDNTDYQNNGKQLRVGEKNQILKNCGGG